MRTKLLAHRTGMAIAPPNTLAGFEHCWRANADALECDITFVEDEPFVLASDSEEKTHINDVWKFLKTHSDIKVYFDVKYYLSDIAGQLNNIHSRLVELAVRKIMEPASKQNLCERIGFVTFAGGLDLLNAAKITDENIATDLVIIFPWERIERCIPYLDSITIGWKNINHWQLFPRALQKIMARAQKNNIEMRGGIANTEKEIVWLVKKGMDAIWTDNIMQTRIFVNRACYRKYREEKRQEDRH